MFDSVCTCSAWNSQRHTIQFSFFFFFPSFLFLRFCSLKLMKRIICVRRTGTLFCLLGHFTFYWDTLRSTWTLPIYWDTFRSPGTLSGLLGHFPVYWGTFLSTGTLYGLLDTSCLLGHFPVYCDTFLSTGTLSGLLRHFPVYWDAVNVLCR